MKIAQMLEIARLDNNIAHFSIGNFKKKLTVLYREEHAKTCTHYTFNTLEEAEDFLTESGWFCLNIEVETEEEESMEDML